MATVNYATLTTQRFVVPGAYVGQLIVPAPGISPDSRIPCYVGVGSRFAIAKNQSIRRSFVFDHLISFSPAAPFKALLPFNAANDKSLARIVKADGTEVKANQWLFIKNPETLRYDQVQINSEVFDPVTTYKISYQSVDRGVLDAFPVQDIREFVNVGNGPDAPDFVEFQDFFANHTITTPAPLEPPTFVNGTSSVEVPYGETGTPHSTGTTVKSASCPFNHDYNRFYTLRCFSVGGSVGTFDRTASFNWDAQPVSSGNSNLPGTPIDPSLAKPTFSFTEARATGSITAIAGSLLVDGETFTLNDGVNPATVFEFDSGGGIVAGRVAVPFTGGDTASTVSSAIVTAINGVGAGLLITAANTVPPLVTLVNDAVGTQGNVTITETVVNAGFLVTGMSGGLNSFVDQLLELGITLRLDFGATHFSALPADVWHFNGQGKALVEVDPRLSNTNQFYEQGAILSAVANTGHGAVSYAAASNPSNVWNAKYEVKQIGAPVDTSVKAYTIVLRSSPNGIRYTAKVGGAAGNLLKVSLVKPTVNNSPLVVSVANSTVTVSLATDNIYALTSTNTDVINAVNALASSPVTAVSAGGTPDVTIATPDVTGTATVTINTTTVTAGVGSAFSTELHAGSVIRISADPTRVYTVAATPALTATTFSLTTPYLGPTTVGATFTEVSVPVGKTVAGVNGVFSGTMAWAEYGERYGVSSTLSYSFNQSAPVNPTLAMSNSVVLTLNMSGGPFAADDTYFLQVKAPRQFYQAKDNRAITLTTESVSNALAGVGATGIGFTTNTPEGSFGSVDPSPQDNSLSPDSTLWLHGRFVLTGNILLAARNLHGGPTTAAGGNRHVVGNKFSFSATINGTIDWSLVSKTSETISKSSILTDVNGFITGAAATTYVILQNVPESIVSVTEVVSGLPVSFALVTSGVNNDNTQYVILIGLPPKPDRVDVKVEYIFKGAEPAPGQIYYVTSKHIRPDDLYNQPILLRSVSDGRTLLAPAEATNHLFIMNEIAMGDIAAPAIMIVQVKDADGDGLYSDVDFADAIDASEAPRAISDIIVLSHFSSLSKQLNSVNKMSDPFKRRLRMTWVGAPIGTTIGSEDEPNTLIYLSRRTLQVFGSNPAHGTRVLVSATSATRDLKLENNVVTEVTLDGSFVAGALAALTASFADPSDTMLRRQLPGFKTVQVYGDSESPENLALGAANIIFFTDTGGGVFRIEEDVTTDKFASDFENINAMTQKMFVTKQVRGQMDEKLIGLVVPSAAAGVSLIRGFIFQLLTSLLNRGLIGRYQNADGSERPISGSDVIVFRDSADPTLYHVLYAYWVKTEIKRIFGLFVVNQSDFGV